MADMYGNYAEPIVGIDGRQKARQLNDLARVIAEHATDDGYDGDVRIFGTCAAAYIDQRYGTEAVTELLSHKDFFDEIYDLIIQLDRCGEFDEVKDELEKFVAVLSTMSTEEIKDAMKKMGADQVDIDHLLMALGRDENEQ